MSKRVKIKGTRRKELDYDAISYVIYTLAKRQVEARRKREAEERAKRRENTHER